MNRYRCHHCRERSIKAVSIGVMVGLAVGMLALWWKGTE